MKYIFLILLSLLAVPGFTQGNDQERHTADSVILYTDTVLVPTTVVVSEATYLLPYVERAYTFREMIISYPHLADSAVFKINFPRMKFPGITTDLSLDSLRHHVATSNRFQIDSTQYFTADTSGSVEDSDTMQKTVITPATITKKDSIQK